MTSLAILRDALPIETAEHARRLFLQTEFAHAPYSDAAHFGRDFADGGLGIPDPDELYCTDFHSVITIPEVREIILHKVLPIVSDVTGHPITGGTNFYYKLHAGGHLRLHRDDYAGRTGFIWYLSKGWKWDWGGLLVSPAGEKAEAILPVFNTLAILDHETPHPHLVTQVAPWAKEPRMMVTGILK